MKKFVFTCGDVNGVGPEIVIKALNKIHYQKSRDRFFFICPANVFKDTIEQVKPIFNYKFDNRYDFEPDTDVLVIDLGDKVQNIGHPTALSGATAYKALELSFQLLKTNKANAVITAPISKIALKMAKINFIGQTEMFAEWTHSKNYAMTFLSNKISASILTVHNSVKDIHKLIKSNKLETLLNVIIRTLKTDLDLKNPKIAVLGLNPHSGEDGLLGTEETNIISPIIKKYSKKFSVNGPFSPDAFFGSKAYENFDFIIGMYHDQILIPFKMLTFGKGVNFTAGLPIVRTSPDHGVAYDIAGKYIANESSIIKAYRYARLIVNNRGKIFDKK